MASSDGDPIIGSISLLGFPWTMNGWAQADGALIPISQQETLYSLFGNAFGGDSSQGLQGTFALPKLSVPIPADQPGATSALSYQVSLNGAYPERQ